MGGTSDAEGLGTMSLETIVQRLQEGIFTSELLVKVGVGGGMCAQVQLL